MGQKQKKGAEKREKQAKQKAQAQAVEVAKQKHHLSRKKWATQTIKEMVFVLCIAAVAVRTLRKFYARYAPLVRPAEAAALTPLSALRLLSVCDSESGEGLFERVWRWPEGADPKGIGNLVRSFFLVARQLDHGMISRVVFEAPEDEAALVPHAGIGEAMEMLCTRNERVVVAVFHESRGAFADEDDEEAREVHVAMRQLVEQARELWSPDVSRADFKTTVDRLCARIVGLPPPPPDPRQPSPPPRPKSM